ncbi:11617_t:CDS:2, partial [Diversispora eburnea]
DEGKVIKKKLSIVATPDPGIKLWLLWILPRLHHLIDLIDIIVIAHAWKNQALTINYSCLDFSGVVVAK